MSTCHAEDGGLLLDPGLDVDPGVELSLESVVVWGFARQRVISSTAACGMRDEKNPPVPITEMGSQFSNEAGERARSESDHRPREPGRRMRVILGLVIASHGGFMPCAQPCALGDGVI
jgi:hypothetical protein